MFCFFFCTMGTNIFVLTVLRGCIQKFEIIPNYHQQGRSETLTSDLIFNLLSKIVMDFLNYALK